MAPVQPHRAEPPTPRRVCCHHRDMHVYWPLFDLRLGVGDVELSPLTEQELPALAEAFPPDVELNPAATLYDVADDGVRRGIVVHQDHWKALGTWSPESWRIQFLVRSSGDIVGVQEVEGVDFLRLRTVDSASYLVQAARGRGIGKSMRRAVLALAFGPLEAEAAITSAWHDNAASLGVSRSVGYRDNGVSVSRRDDGRDIMVHLRMTRDEWLDTDAAREIRIDGFEPCRHLFGL
jgi:RimJ/RimL family protein N-acetyltransferase